MPVGSPRPNDRFSRKGPGTHSRGLPIFGPLNWLPTRAVPFGVSFTTQVGGRAEREVNSPMPTYDAPSPQPNQNCEKCGAPAELLGFIPASATARPTTFLNAGRARRSRGLQRQSANEASLKLAHRHVSFFAIIDDRHARYSQSRARARPRSCRARKQCPTDGQTGPLLYSPYSRPSCHYRALMQPRLWVTSTSTMRPESSSTAISKVPTRLNLRTW